MYCDAHQGTALHQVLTVGPADRERLCETILSMCETGVMERWLPKHQANWHSHGEAALSVTQTARGVLPSCLTQLQWRTTGVIYLQLL